MAATNRVTLSLQQRLDVLKDLETISISAAAIKYKVARKTIWRIKRQGPSLLQFNEKYKLQKKRQRMRRPKYEELEQRLLAWFMERRALGDPLSDALLLKKSAEFKKCIPSCASFKGSEGWLAKFKWRNNIRLGNVYGEKCSADDDAAKKFIGDFCRFVKEENIDMENVYNMDESVLLWKALPNKKVFAGPSESGSEMRKDRLTIGLCANATGSNKLMPIVVYNDTRVIKGHWSHLPVVFKSQKNAGLNRIIFTDWYENHFKPSVRAFQRQKETCGTVILLVDNCAAHRVQTDMDDHFKIMYLPRNIPSLIQPMNQGVIEKLKKGYRHTMMHCVVNYCSRVEEFYDNYTFKDCLQLIGEAWEDINSNDIQNAWKKILPTLVHTTNNEESTKEHTTRVDFQHLFSHVTGEECTRQDVVEFLSTCEIAEGHSLIHAENEHEEEEKHEADGNKLEPGEDVKEEHEMEINEDKPIVLHEDVEGECFEREEYQMEVNEEKPVMLREDVNEEETHREDERSAARNELHYIFERLEHYGRQKSTFIKDVLQVMKTEFLQEYQE